MSDTTTRSAVSTIRTALGIGGLIAVILGILILVWPGRTAEVLVALIAIYAIAGGLVYAGLGMFSSTLGGWARVGTVILGIVFIVAGIFAFVNLPATTAWFGTFVGIMIGIMWIIEGIVSLMSLSATPSRGWTIFFALISLIAGIVLLFSPGYVAVLWLFVGISLIVLGVIQIVRAFTFRAHSAPQERKLW